MMLLANPQSNGSQSVVPGLISWELLRKANSAPDLLDQQLWAWGTSTRAPCDSAAHSGVRGTTALGHFSPQTKPEYLAQGPANFYKGTQSVMFKTLQATVSATHSSGGRQEKVKVNFQMHPAKFGRETWGRKQEASHKCSFLPSPRGF